MLNSNTFETLYFKTKISKSKFFLGLSHFSVIMINIGRNRLSVFQKVFENENLEIEKFFHYDFFGLIIFVPNNQNSEKRQSQKIWPNFLVEIGSQRFKTYFKTKISKSKIFSHYKIFSWDLVIFCPK